MEPLPCLVKQQLVQRGQDFDEQIVAGGVSVEPPMLSFGTKQYAIDTRRAVVQRAGILGRVRC